MDMKGGNPQTRKTLELEQAMVKELKQQNFEEALEAANAVLQHNPGHRRAQEFAKLLQELIQRREEDSDSSSDQEDEDVEGGSDQVRQEMGSQDEGSSSSGSSESSSESSREGSDAEDEPGASGQEQGKGQAGSEADAAARQLDGLSLNTSNLRMSHASRRQLRESISVSLKTLREKEQMQKVVDADPLLGA